MMPRGRAASRTATLAVVLVLLVTGAVTFLWLARATLASGGNHPSVDFFTLGMLLLTILVFWAGAALARRTFRWSLDVSLGVSALVTLAVVIGFAVLTSTYFAPWFDFDL